ncbi:Serine-threonine protein kinase [Entamoeba marina]
MSKSNKVEVDIDSLNKWNNYFSSQVDINVDIKQTLKIKARKNTHISYIGIVNLTTELQKKLEKCSIEQLQQEINKDETVKTIIDVKKPKVISLTGFDLRIDESNIQNKKLFLTRKMTKSYEGNLRMLGDKNVIVDEIISKDMKFFEKQVKIHQAVRFSQIMSFMYYVVETRSLIFECPIYKTLKSFLEMNKGKPILSRLLQYKFCLDIANPYDFVNCKLGNICCSERVGGDALCNSVTNPIHANQAENFRMPPEITSIDSSYNFQCDVYSYGVLMFHILTQLVNTNPIGESGHVLPQYTRQIPSALINIINNCCSINVDERPDFGVIVDKLRTIMDKEISHGKEQYEELDEMMNKKDFMIPLINFFNYFFNFFKFKKIFFKYF